MDTIQAQMITFPSGGRTTPAYLARPAGEGKFPGLVVIQEWWGLVPHIKDVTERFAQQGFIALAPDLYHGESAGEPDEARKLAMELDREHAVEEIVAAIQYLQKQDDVSPKKIGVVGWCMGGALALATAATSTDTGAAVVFYGNPGDLNRVRQIKAPVLGLYGELDAGIPVDLAHAFDEELEKQAIPHEVHIYPGAGHAFFNDSRPHIYHPEAAADAWQRTLSWFRKYLR